MYCNNCGEQGHVFRTCKDPIISCGLLFIRSAFEPMVLPVDPKSVSVLMVRRKDSMSYMEFIRGKYNPNDEEYVKRQLSNMTIQEQKLILEESFEVLWTKLWGNSRDMEPIEYEHARDKFNALDKKRLIYEVPSKFSEPEWGFPKGRRNYQEKDYDRSEERRVGKECRL